MFLFFVGCALFSPGSWPRLGVPGHTRAAQTRWRGSLRVAAGALGGVAGGGSHRTELCPPALPPDDLLGAIGCWERLIVQRACGPGPRRPKLWYSQLDSDAGSRQRASHERRFKRFFSELARDPQRPIHSLLTLSIHLIPPALPFPRVSSLSPPPPPHPQFPRTRSCPFRA